MPTQIYKPVTSTISTRQETSSLVVIPAGSALTYSLSDRTSITEINTNYFVSFNLPVSYDALSSGSTLALTNPEIFQINVDKAVIVPIPREYYSELIDGRSITFTVPQNINGVSMSSKTVVSSTYTTLQKKQTNAFLGNNLAFLFCDEINLPYTGTVNGISRSAATTWNTPVYSNRPAAVPYSILTPAIDINTDQRVYSAQNQAIVVTPTYPTNTNQGYNYDIPVGIACLDKGFMILTHPKIVNNMPWSQGLEQYTNVTNSLSGTNNIYFSANSSINFVDININYITAVVCIALPAEFFFTNNPSWDIAKNALEYNNNTNNYDPLYITEIGLYNLKNELIAIAKTSEPVLKGYTDILNFSLEIQT